MTLPRLPCKTSTKRKIAKALRGRARPQDVKDRIAATMRGRKHTPEAIANMVAARARPKETQLQFTRRRKKVEGKERELQWRKDMFAALRVVKSKRLFKDVRKSEGWAWRRTVFDKTGRVSDGWAMKLKWKKPKRKQDQWIDRYFAVQEWLNGKPSNRS